MPRITNRPTMASGRIRLSWEFLLMKVSSTTGSISFMNAEPATASINMPPRASSSSLRYGVAKPSSRR